MFTMLLTLPLFQGLSYDDVTRIVESTRLDFSTLTEGAILCRQDEPCTDLHIIIDGRLKARTASADRSWAVEEEVTERSIVGLDVLYGRRRTHTSTFTALTTTRILSIDKRTMGALFRYFEVMQINAFNVLTSQIATRDRVMWLPPADSLEQRITRFMLSHVSRPAGRKRFDISMALLGRYLGEDQRRISKALHNLMADGLVNLQRRAVEVPAFEKLLLR